MKYINEEDLRKAMYQEAFEKESNMQKWESGCWIRYKLFENVLDAMPSADVVEVKRGWWMQIEPFNYQCFNCSALTPIQFNFCPNCGADMREKRETE